MEGITSMVLCGGIGHPSAIGPRTVPAKPQKCRGWSPHAPAHRVPFTKRGSLLWRLWGRVGGQRSMAVGEPWIWSSNAQALLGWEAFWDLSSY